MARSRLRIILKPAVLALWLVGALGVAAAAMSDRPSQAPAPLQAEQGSRTGAITGVVVDATTGQPVPGATVALKLVVALPGFLPPRAVTDSRGRFVFKTLPPSDSYFLDTNRFGYAHTRYGWTAPNGSLAISDILRISVADGQWIDNIKIPLWRLGSIAGRVVDERSEPIVGAAVRAFTTVSIAGAPQLVAGPVTTTDDRGVYRLSDLSPGRYLVSVLSVQATVLTTTPERPPQRPVGELESGGIGAGLGGVAAPGIDVDGRHRLIVTNFATPPPPATDRSRAYPATFYPGVHTTASATSIEMGYGDSRAGIDFQLVPVPTVRVSGRLEGATSAVPPMVLRLMPSGSERLGFGSEAATTVVEPDGRFTFLNVPAGQYTLIAQRSVMDFTTGSNSTARLPDAPGFPSTGISVGSMSATGELEYLSRSGAPVPFWGRTTVSVGQRDLDELVVPVHPIVQIRGRVVYTEGTKPPARALVRAQPANGDPSLGLVTTRTDPTNTFTIDGLLAGTYLLTSDSYTYGLVSVMSNGRDVADTGFDASLGQHFDDVVITLTDKKAEITGLVHDQGQAATAAVIAFPVQPARWVNFGWDPPRFRATRSASSGAYRLGPLPEGDYFVIAVDLARIDDWADQRFLAAAAPLATRVSLKWGEIKNQNLTVVGVTVK